MTGSIRRLIIGIIAFVLVLLFFILLVLPATLTPGVMRDLDGLPLVESDFTAIPPDVVSAARKLAGEQYREQQARDLFVQQALASYIWARDKDFVIIFNPGGWGWNAVKASPGWTSLIEGIQNSLSQYGYTAAVFDYQRTKRNFWGYAAELISFVSLHPLKTKDMTARIRFLTEQLPDLKVIICAESNGSIISDRVMRLMEGNPRVYSIQTGPPFWYKNTTLKKTLVLTSNGIIPDAFSVGDVLSITASKLREAFKALTSGEGVSKILRELEAPGHEYFWKFPVVSSRIKRFLEQNFNNTRRATWQTKWSWHTVVGWTPQPPSSG
ncbi:MAG: hypothetical protein HYX81_00225 [Chloroflexi bacterium]|nr:hypothetical protein [Chloroflexota bacterium]